MDRELPSYFHGEAERAVLGCCVVYPECLEDCRSTRINSTWFGSDAHKKIWESLESMYKNSEDIDQISIALDIQLKGNLDRVGGVGYVASLAGEIGSGANIRQYIKVLQEHVKLRRLFILSEQIKTMLAEPGIQSEEMLEFMSKGALHVEELTISDPVTMRTLYGKVQQQWASPGRFDKIGTGYPAIDRKMDGLYFTESTIIGGEAGIGKTSLVSNMARRICQEAPVLLFSLEMGGDIIAIRDMSSVGNFKLQDLRKGVPDQKKFIWMLSDESLDNMFVETSVRDIDDIEALCKVMCRKYGIKVIILDYIQLCVARSLKTRNREQEVSYIGSTLKRIAIDCNVHTIGLSQLDEYWRREGKQSYPTGNNLRESKSLKHHADNVLIICPGKNDNERSILVDKARNNETGFIYMGFIGNLTKFVDDKNQITARFGDEMR